MKTTRVAFFLVALSLFSSVAFAQAPAPLPVNHEFDFWIGDWEVFQFGSDSQIGENRIEAVAGGHALLEHWTAVGSPHTGKSLNSYNPHTQQWQQYWIGSGGVTSEYKGALQDGKMVLIAENISAQGTKYLMRGTWTPLPDGSVRQQFEVSSNQGESWQTIFDGHYRRKAAR